MKSLEILETINNKKERIENLKREIKTLYEDISQDGQLLAETQKQERRKREKEYFTSIGVKEYNDGLFILFNKQVEFKGIINYRDKYKYIDKFRDWLKENKLYAHSLSSFRNRKYEWYNKTLREQLESLCWKFTKTGELKNVSW